jgi:hypothetical protein
MRLRSGMMLLAGQFVLLGVTLELLGRIVDPLGISYYPESARFFDRLIVEEPIGYRLPPNMDDRFWGVSVKTNSLGMRDREVNTPKPIGERRVMLIGDSGVFSLGVEYEDSIPAQLERALNQDATPGIRYRTLNMGVPSYNTEQQLTQLERLGLSLEPDCALLYFAANDIEPKMWVYEKRRNPLVNLAQRSYAASISFILARRLRMVAGGGNPELIQYSSFAEGNPRWQAIAKSLKSISERLKERGVPLLVVASGEDDEPHVKLLRDVANQDGFGFEQLEVLSSESEWSRNPEKFVNSPIDHHCNPLGCKVLATEFARLLENAEML